MLPDVVGANLKYFILDIFHVLHCAFIEYVDPEIILDVYFASCLVDFNMINATHKLDSFLTDMLGIADPLDLHIHWLKLNWLSKCRMEARHYGACRVDLVAELAFVLVLLHIVKFDFILSHALFIIIVDGTEDFFLLFNTLSLLE